MPNGSVPSGGSRAAAACAGVPRRAAEADPPRRKVVEDLRPEPEGTERTCVSLGLAGLIRRVDHGNSGA
ncbi:hypothetical protein ACFWVC_28710 [Streptomyces sp. NPDC058691]|uniref:hypothetical protein n=1 Tax=Streptomyces sp. NPDC058691 TaxID=3346601 RepID=UPI0036688A6A